MAETVSCQALERAWGTARYGERLNCLYPISSGESLRPSEDAETVPSASESCVRPPTSEGWSDSSEDI